MDNGSTLLNSIADTLWLEPSRPRLLLEWEPSHRVFFSNLFDILLRRQVPHVELESKPARFWRDVFVPVGVPWWSLLESGLWHTAGVLVLLVVSQGWGTLSAIDKPQLRRSSILYYRPEPSFPALGSRPPVPPARAEHTPESRSPLEVVREAKLHSPPIVAPPDIAALTKPKPLPPVAKSASVAPAMPLSAASGAQRKSLQLGSSVIAPPPDLQPTTAPGRSGGLKMAIVAPPPVIGGGLNRAAATNASGLQTLAVAPAPELTGTSGRRGIAGPGVSPVAPAPAIQGGSLGSIGKGQNGNLLHVEVVGPAPKFPTGEGGGTSRIARAGLGGAGAAIVPPPPSVQGSGITRGRGGSGSLGSGSGVVPPAPSVNALNRIPGGAGGGLGGGSGFGDGYGLGVVPPAPSVGETGGAGRLRGHSGGGVGDGAGSGTGSGLGNVIPPAPSVGGIGTSAGAGGGLRGGGGGTGDGLGFGVVPPAPSVGEMGGSGSSGGGGRGGGLGNGSGRGVGSGLGSGIIPPAPSLGDGTGSGGRGSGNSPNANLAVVAPPPLVEGGGGSNAEGPNPVIEEMPMRIVGLAFALPSTSFSSNYEVFIAEKQFNGHKELIKLVYWFLPYQQRLSESHLDATRMYRLRVTRDHDCDESLAHMTVSPTGQVYSGAHLPDDFPRLSPENQNLALPCYRTTADDYRKALSKQR